MLAVVLAVAVYLDSDRYGLRLFGVGFDLDPARGAILRRTERFVKDLQFKDFVHAATFHAPSEREKFDIPKLIEAKFLIKPEHLDIQHFEVLRVDVFAEGGRGKALVKCTVKVLNTGQTKDVEAVFYWYRSEEPQDWFMDLRSSL